MKKEIDMESVSDFVEDFDDAAVFRIINSQVVRDVDTNVWDGVWGNVGVLKHGIHNYIEEDLENG